jgi:hypothetical protein
MKNIFMLYPHVPALIEIPNSSFYLFIYLDKQSGISSRGSYQVHVYTLSTCKYFQCFAGLVFTWYILFLLAHQRSKVGLQITLTGTYHFSLLQISTI